MKNFIHFMLTCLISTFAFFGVLGSDKHTIWPCLAIAFGVWALFIWRYYVRLKRADMKRQFDEHMFREFMRYKQSNSRT